MRTAAAGRRAPAGAESPESAAASGTTTAPDVRSVLAASHDVSPTRIVVAGMLAATVAAVGLRALLGGVAA